MNFRLIELGLLCVLVSACGGKSKSSKSSTSAGAATNTGTDVGSDGYYDDGSSSISECVSLAEPVVVREDSGVEVRANFTYSTANKYGITGVGASAAGNNATGLYVELRRILYDGTLDSTAKYYRIAGMTSDSTGEKYLSLPSGYVASGIGFGVNSSGETIETLRLRGHNLVSTGAVGTETECIIDKNGNQSCASSLSLSGDASSRYMEFDTSYGFILQGLGLGIKDGKVNALFGKSAQVILGTSCN